MEGGNNYSINTGKIRTFGTVDFVLLSLMISFNIFVGMYYAIKDRKKQNTKTYMLADKSMGILPVAMSLVVTFLSSMTLVGIPVEVYNFNTMYWLFLVGMLMAVGATAHIFMPFFYRLGITTVYEYLQMRFNTPVRILGSILVLMQTLYYIAFSLYAPSLAISSVTSLSLWGSVVGVGLVVTIYTALGGMKAVMWTDTFRAAVILAGLLAALIRGSIVTGGFAHAWEVAAEHDRIKFDDFSFNPGTRHSVWSVVIGGGFLYLSMYGIHQSQVQRCITCPSVRKAQIALWISYPPFVLLTSLCFMIGVVMFAFYASCHPMGIISKTDQLLPLFVMDTLADYDGIPGAFVACIFSGSICSMGAGLSALASITIKDLLLPYCCHRLTEFKTTVITKILVVIFGLISMLLAYVVANMGNMLQAAMTVYGVLNGPLFGLFLLGMFFPWANSSGAVVGCIASLVFMAWIGVGSFVYKVSTHVRSSVITSGCVWRNLTANTTTATTTTAANASVMSNISITTTAPSDPTDIPAYDLYTLSYLYYTITGGTVVVVIGLIFSFISGHRKPSSLDPRLICPLFDTLFPCLPECILKPLRFGVDHDRKYEKYEEKLKQIQADMDQTLKIKKDEEVSPCPSAVNGHVAVSNAAFSITDEEKKVQVRVEFACGEKASESGHLDTNL